ncbi:MAG: SEC-C domain-containing protein [candidate division Zixibacteria bacterium]|nr:SEC-C domain-containing protein [candidate division Zixibacteria bacterium]
MFHQLMDTIDRETVEMIFRLQVAQPPPLEPSVDMRRLQTVHAAAGALGGSTSDDEPPTAGKPQPLRRTEEKVGRNDPCPCGSGKKYKKCHGAVAV